MFLENNEGIQTVKSVCPQRTSPFLKDIIFTTVVTVVVAICNIIIIRLIAKGLGAEELGVYTLVRRTVATVLPLSSLSIGIGLARYIALYEGKGERTESILPVAFILSSSTSLLVCLTLFPFSGYLSEVIFNKEGMEIPFRLILFLLFGESLFTCLYSYYRGRHNMFYANIWGFLVMGIMPLFITLLTVHMNDVTYIIFGLGMMFYLSLFALVPKIVDGLRKTDYVELKATARKLMHYSIPRAPGGLASTFIFSFGVLVSPYTGSIVHAAYMSIGIWILQILQTATESFGLVVLPKAASILGRGSEEYLANKLRSMYDFILHVGLFTVIQLFLILDFLIYLWVGKEYTDAVPIARIIILSMIFFFYYTMMRNIIDAVETRPINAINMYLGLLVTILSTLIFIKFGFGVFGLAIGLNLGLITLGVLTYLFMIRRYHINLLPDRFYPIMIVNMLLGFCIYFIKYNMMSNQYGYRNFAVTLAAQIMCGMIYIIILKKLDVTWIRDIEDRINYQKPVSVE